MIWIVEAAIDFVTSAASDEIARRAMRRRRQRRGEPEPEEPTFQQAKKDLLWIAGFILMDGAGLAALDSWSPWFSWSLAAVGLSTFVVGLVLRRRLVQRGDG